MLGQERQYISTEAYTSFTENVARVQWHVGEYREEIYGLATPVSAGWPIYLEPTLVEGTTVVPFDLNTRQIEWFYREFPNSNFICHLGDISNPGLQMQNELDKCNFLFVSNIPDWLAGVTGRADQTVKQTHDIRINRFIEQSIKFLEKCQSTNSPQFIMISSTKANFLDRLCCTIANKLENLCPNEMYINARKVSNTNILNAREQYPINNYRIIEVYPE